jgi:hypothetical protein
VSAPKYTYHQTREGALNQQKRLRSIHKELLEAFADSHTPEEAQAVHKIYDLFSRTLCEVNYE